MLHYVSYYLAFSFSFAAGIIIAYLLNSLFVFNVPLTLYRLTSYPIVYCAQYLASLALLSLEVRLLGLDQRFAPLINIVLLLPFTFLLNKHFLTRGMK